MLLETSPSKPDGFATSPDRGGKTCAAQPEASGTGEPGDVNLAPTKVDSFAKGSPTRGAGTATAVTERFNPESDSSDPQKEAHSDAPAGQ